MHPNPLAASVCLALLVAAPAWAAPLDVAGTWTGVLSRAHETSAGTGALAQRDAQLTGWLGLDVPGVAGDVPVTGKAKRRGLVVAGELDGTRVRWVARWRAQNGELRGRLRVRGAGGRLRGMLALHRTDGGPRCGNVYFRDFVMPEVLVPVCAQCHVPDGLAEITTFRVTVDDPLATAASAVAHVDASAPLSSRLLRKPRAELPHDGGVQLEAGSARDEVLRHWIELVAGCLEGGGEQTGAQLYADWCAGCHGADAGGLPGGDGERARPAIRCATRVVDAVTTGRGDAMPPIPELNSTDLAKIEQHLDGLCDEHGRSGAELFASNCVTCHGPDARGATNALGVAGKHIRCHRGIGETVRNGLGDMPAFSGLGPAEVSALGGFLLELCPPGSAGGDELYASNCARCHGDAAGGLPAPPGERRRPAVRCATAPRIADALDVGRGDAMPAFPGVGAADLGALTGFLDATCTAAGLPISDVYDGNCASCHGETAAGSTSALEVEGPDIRCSGDVGFANLIADGEGEMPAFPELAPDAAAIAAYVRGSFCQEAGVDEPAAVSVDGDRASPASAGPRAGHGRQNGSTVAATAFLSHHGSAGSSVSAATNENHASGS
jgi:mono/diheme cytochrome c family protein